MRRSPEYLPSYAPAFFFYWSDPQPIHEEEGICEQPFVLSSMCTPWYTFSDVKSLVFGSFSRWQVCFWPCHSIHVILHNIIPDCCPHHPVAATKLSTGSSLSQICTTTTTRMGLSSGYGISCAAFTTDSKAYYVWPQALSGTSLSEYQMLQCGNLPSVATGFLRFIWSTIGDFSKYHCRQGSNSNKQPYPQNFTSKFCVFTRKQSRSTSGPVIVSRSRFSNEIGAKVKQFWCHIYQGNMKMYIHKTGLRNIHSCASVSLPLLRSCPLPVTLSPSVLFHGICLTLFRPVSRSYLWSIRQKISAIKEDDKVKDLAWILNASLNTTTWTIHRKHANFRLQVYHPYEIRMTVELHTLTCMGIFRVQRPIRHWMTCECDV